ncbi:unnamed protein product [Paramecium pentaurelia]|uniref:Transmembrane protein n=1 Tax=Paramecium pentaurelia TaxID=43138 RepID=A0A8S1SH51_9CILI|nr:unnamed protein product [Paramecium pentaurelia]
MFEDRFLETIKQQLLISKVVPVTINPKNILKSLLAVENKLEEENLYQSICKKQELIIKNLNEENADVILSICKFIKLEIIKQMEGSKEDIKQGVLKQIEIECINWPQYKNPRWPEYLEYFNNLSIQLINHTYMLMEQILIDLTTKPFVCEEFHQYITDKLEHCMIVLSMEMSDFARVINNEIFYWELKKYFNSIIQNVHLYINRTSLFCNTQMEYLNETLTKYHTLANIRTYQILQIETSQYIIDQCHVSLKEMLFHRIEFEIFDKDLVKQIIRHFYEYSPLNQGLYEMSTLTKSFQDAIQMYYILDDKYFATADLDSKLFAQDEECIKYKIWLNEKRKQQSALANQPVLKGSVGAGLGCLIVDSVDPKIPWDEKLKRAGISSVATGLVGAAMRIPVVGVILSQALLFYAIRVQANNKVVDKSEKMKNIAHLGFQSSFGIGTAVAGQILIPIPVLGALIGGTVGGVFMGLYTKFIIPKTKPSIKVMINELMGRQYGDGLFQYDDQVLKIMKINQQHYFGLKPENLSDCQWLTILMVYMINEIHYLTNVQGLEKINELQQQIEKKPKDENKLIKQIKEVETELEQQEIINVKMERSRYYIQEQEINTLQIVDKVGEFINGMIANFRL